ncbi:hypothetical protein ABLE68_16620 [Nocardioides sp. CN2-186]|uniref:hypothetical protein n=1 Tax=Nocardioides tweenelious TaxID=3156607 RepID=UPI0032B37EAD
MRKALLAVAAVVVVLVVAGGAWWVLGDDDETEVRGTCGTATYEMSAENDDAGLEVTFELQSAGAGERWQVVVEQDGTPVLEGERLTDEDAELDVDVTVDESDGTSFTVTATPENGEACTASLTS